jgi:hypothetical protein
MESQKTLYWCNTHQRETSDANHCVPFHGIMLPCRVVNLTGIAVIENTPNPDWVNSTPEDRRRDVFIIEERGEVRK